MKHKNSVKVILIISFLLILLNENNLVESTEQINSIAISVKNTTADILYSLYVCRKNCIGECFSNALNVSNPKIDGINSNDLRVKIITHDVIKHISEDVINQDLTPLFDLLEINYVKDK